jgi:hypothetical protein
MAGKVHTIESLGWTFEVRDGFIYARKGDVTFYCDVTIAGEPAVDCWSDSDPEEQA